MPRGCAGKNQAFVAWFIPAPRTVRWHFSERKVGVGGIEEIWDLWQNRENLWDLWDLGGNSGFSGLDLQKMT